MYESHFGLTARPFPEVPQAECYFPSEAAEQARSAIVRCLTRGAGAALLLGAPGTGKSMLCERLAFELQSRFPIVNLNWGHPSSRRGLLQAILYKLDLPYRNLDDGELRLSLIDHLTRSPNCPHGMVLIVDEAHLLPMELLEEIRILTNLVANREPRVRLVLTGLSALEETLAVGRMQSLQQRIAARCTIEGFRREETRTYLRQTISRCGGVPDAIFSTSAPDAVHALSQGIPRLINQLCDHALIMAFVQGMREVGESLIQEAWSDLQQLPISLETYRASHRANPLDTDAWDSNRLDVNQLGNDVLEFGSLDESPPSVPFLTDRTIDAVSPEPGEGWAPPIIPISTQRVEPRAESRRDDAGDLFGDDFSEQESVLDRYSSRTAVCWPTAVRPAVSFTEPALPIASKLPEPLPLAIDLGEQHATSEALPQVLGPVADSRPTVVMPPVLTIDWTQSIDLASMQEMVDNSPWPVVANPSPLPPSPSEPTLAEWDDFAPTQAHRPKDALLHSVPDLSVDELLSDVDQLVASACGSCGPTDRFSEACDESENLAAEAAEQGEAMGAWHQSELPSDSSDRSVAPADGEGDQTVEHGPDFRAWARAQPSVTFEPRLRVMTDQAATSRPETGRKRPFRQLFSELEAKRPPDRS